MSGMKDFLNRLVGNELDDIISELSSKHLKVLIDLPGFNNEDGLCTAAQSVDSSLIANGHYPDDAEVNWLLTKHCLQWVEEGKTFRVHRELCGTMAKKAIVQRYVDVSRGGDGSDTLMGIFGDK